MDAKLFAWTGALVPVIGQGTWRMGESRRDRERELAALVLGLDLGLEGRGSARVRGVWGTLSNEAPSCVAPIPKGGRLPLNGKLHQWLAGIVTSVVPEETTYVP
jgi:hypothetical protein